MIARGVEAHDSSTMITSVMRGELSTNQALRNEFLRLIGEQ
jgi:GTP cyclohydrolase I